ncbi:hypothetical protein OESDEN_02020 [Oesophagostomum dentatum]|uniref:Uncharacterized protein n=1 Tax=Oesophagostomum dentatum TaxID=61180 RepID=A0A0B1TL55_OESDE|nr:hypothetical protein OESDEN_02020 [Oesophagostomum dentatum]
MAELNCSEPIPIPDVQTFYASLSTSQYILLTAGAGIATAVITLGLVHLFHVWKYISDERIQTKLYFLSLLFPLLVTLSLASMFSPRSNPILTSIQVFYVQFCMYTTVSLCRVIYGGRERMCSVLSEEKAVVNFQVPPCCCCMVCLPKPAPSERTLRILECLSLQGAVVRAFIVILNCHFVSERPLETEHTLLITELSVIPSLLLALFGSHVIAKLTAPHIQQYKTVTMFRFADISLALFTAQLPLIFDLILIKFGIITCGPVQSALGNAKYINSFVQICEVFLLSLLASWLLAPEKSALFDKYPHRQVQLSGTHEKMLPNEEL